MTYSVRDGKFDVAIAAAPGVAVWPSVGVRAISSLCAEMGLIVGLFGGDDIRVRGVIPLPGTGGILVAEDVQGRIHRIHSRSIIKVRPGCEFSDPFPGWRSAGLIPLSTAVRLREESQVPWDPTIVVLGTGNRALRFASELLENGTPEVYCIEPYAEWAAKRFAGWEVERRRFEMNGGKLVEARPIALREKAALCWELKVQDRQGVRLLDVARVVSAGPFGPGQEIREYPAGSLLFELEQTAPNTATEDMDGWTREEEHGRLLGTRLIRALGTDLARRREELDKLHKRTRGRLKRYAQHFEAPFTPSFQGKFIAPADLRGIRAFSGVPTEAQKKRPVASIECFEEIACNACEKVCPTDAISIGPGSRRETGERPPADRILRILTEELCTACGLCLQACPSNAIVLLEDREDRSSSRLTFAYRGLHEWKESESAALINRRGESLGNGRVTGTLAIPDGMAPTAAAPAGPAPRPPRLIQVDVPAHLVWEARAIRRSRKVSASEDEAYLTAVARSSRDESKVEITLGGEKRLVRDQIPVTVALFETGRSRPEDVLFCRDSSCRQCQLSVDGVNKLACETITHRGMVIRLGELPKRRESDQSLCPCLGITTAQVADRIQQGQLQSPEAVLSVAHLGEGKCHGRLCGGAFLRLLAAQGLDVSQWIDWRFPWSEWVLSKP